MEKFDVVVGVTNKNHAWRNCEEHLHLDYVYGAQICMLLHPTNVWQNKKKTYSFFLVEMS